MLKVEVVYCMRSQQSPPVRWAMTVFVCFFCTFVFSVFFFSYLHVLYVPLCTSMYLHVPRAFINSYFLVFSAALHRALRSRSEQTLNVELSLSG